MSSSSHTIFCLCGKPHAPQPKKGPISNTDFHGICDEIKDEKKKRNKIALSSIGCPFKFCVTYIKKEDKFLNNQKASQNNYIPLQTEPYFEQADVDQKQDGNIPILNPPKACHTMLNLIKDSPIHPLHPTIDQLTYFW